MRPVRDVWAAGEGVIGSVELSRHEEWPLLARHSEPVALVHEEELSRASRRRRDRVRAAASVVTLLLARGSLGGARPSRMVIVAGSAELGRMWRRGTREGEIELVGDPERTIDRRVAAALLLLFVTGRGG